LRPRETPNDLLSRRARIGSKREPWGIPPRQEQLMAKGQKKSNREIRKPKKEKIKTNASQPSLKPGSVKGLENFKNK
jgi:hypothetical protein